MTTRAQHVPDTLQLAYDRSATSLSGTLLEGSLSEAANTDQGRSVSPNSSVITPVSIPPPRMVSKPVEPVVIWTSSERLEWISVAVVNPIGTNLHAKDV